MRKVVVNSSPLIALGGIAQLHLLRTLYGSVMIPDAVYREISAKPDSVCKKTVDEARDWIQVYSIENLLAKNMFQSRLHAGEVEVLILAQEKAADLVIMDDALAKRHARYLGMRVTGTLGVLMKARRENHITALRPLIRKMQRIMCTYPMP
ncbi:MAG: DUF3368 domain-containing protein [Schwartzia sp.]|nr:DUF3368 domain-containing protein [Schwartzia sp. (in: firmicutes)]